MFSSSTKLSATSGSPPDPQFNYVTMLLHGDGTNGAQNNTFLDSSSNNFTITRNGNTTQGSFSPYGSNWSNAFTASSGSYLSVPYSSAFNLTGDFTVECWINPSQLPTANRTGSPLYPRIFSFGTYDAANSIGLEINSNDVGTVNALVVWYNGIQYYSANNIVAVGNWYHCAMVRSGTTIKIYLNGTSVITITGASAAVNTSQALFIASLQSYTTDANACFKGYISNLRVVKGTAVYTTTFTPPTTPLTAITNTVLLTCQSNRFVDNSTTAATITSFGTPSVQRFNPFGTSTAYSTSVIGGSGYFDGSGDYLTVPDSTQTDLGSGDFTVECWFYQFSTKVASCISLNGALSANGYALGASSIASGKIWWYATTTKILSNTYFNYNSWNHVAVVRSGSTTTMYQNGVNVGSFTDTQNYSGGITYIGSDEVGNQEWNGYISDVRIVKGTAVYTSAFTPPTAPLTAVTNTQLLTNMTNGAIFDNAMMNDLETVGNAQISTSVVKYGTGSLYFDGTGDELSAPLSQLLGFGSGDFTVEMWAYFNTSVISKTLITSTNGTTIDTSNTGYIRAEVTVAGSGKRITGSQLMTTGTWYHIAYVRTTTTLTLYVDGTSVGTYSIGTQVCDAVTGATRIGVFDGYIDDLRITKGYARYTSNFTAPTAAFSNTGPI